MKRFYLFLLLSAITFSMGFAQRIGKTGVSMPADQMKMHYADSRIAYSDADALLACPEGTVHAGEYSSEGWSGFQSSDQGRPGMATKFYQSFSDCYYTVNGVRFLGIFNYWDDVEYNWYGCTSRGGIDEDGYMTEPVRFEVSFYTIASDGSPGDEIYSREVDVIGNRTDVLYYDYFIYEFFVDLDETLKMESGFVSFSAVDMGDSPTCWYSALTSGEVPGYGYIQLGNNLSASSTCMPYCLLGTGEYSAQKALKLNRLLTPSQSSTGKYEKVQVELTNVGSDAVSDTRLELWADGELLATEDVGVVIESGGSYKYTFKQRIDCAGAGIHQFEIRNVTAGDEKICSDVLEFFTEMPEAGQVCESYSIYCDEEYITRVTIGDIDNESEDTIYSDYTHLKTYIEPGEELTLTIEHVGYAVYIAVWVDWNGNGSFYDEGDFISYVTQGSIPISIPEGVEVTEGDKVMRIIVAYYEPSVCGEYYYGETEDYTLTVKRPNNAPVISLNTSYIEEFMEFDQKNTELQIMNGGTATMTGQLFVDYALPYSPSNRHIKRATENDPEEMRFVKSPLMRSSKVPVADDEIEYVLKYDKDQTSAISLTSGDLATYATYYPGDMLANLSGMTISSVDVYIVTASERSAVVIYGENTQSSNGELLLDQNFVPVENAWNRIELSTPITISDKDLWIGIQMEGFVPDTYQIGVDLGPAAIGFGDIVNVGGPTWWSIADLGIDSNLCIRTNVSGTRTPAISWLTLGESEFTINADQTENIDVVLDATKLSNTLYEATIEVSSNDPLNGTVKVPVYLINGSTNIEKVNDSAGLIVYPNPVENTLNILGDFTHFTLMSVNGAVMLKSTENGVNVSNLPASVYLLKIESDKNAPVVKKIIKK